MAEPERLEPMEPPFSLLRRQLPSREAKCGTKMVSIILCAPTERAFVHHKLLTPPS